MGSMERSEPKNPQVLVVKDIVIFLEFWGEVRPLDCGLGGRRNTRGTSWSAVVQRTIVVATIVTNNMSLSVGRFLSHNPAKNPNELHDLDK